MRTKIQVKSEKETKLVSDGTTSRDELAEFMTGGMNKTEYTRLILQDEDLKEPEWECGAAYMTLTMYGVGYGCFHGCVDVTDPCYNRDESCRMNRVEIANGKYLCGVWKNEEPANRVGEGRVFAIGIYLDGKVPEYGTMEEIGRIGVDSGLAGFFHDKPDFDDEEWFDICERIGNADVFFRDGSFFSSSGYGDGCYPVYAAKNKEGVIVAIETRFIEE